MRTSLLLSMIAAGLIGCMAASSQASSENFPMMVPLTMLEPDEFPILPWGETPGDLDALKELRACGFNLAGFVGPDDLDLVSEAGLKGLVFHSSARVDENDGSLDEARIDQQVAAFVQQVGQHPAIFGYFLCDEPGAHIFPGLSKRVGAFRKAAPRACTYINLFPNYASPQQMNVSTYEEYLESYIQTVRPRFICYDHYALMDDGSLRDGYFQNLEAVRNAAQRHGLPFWNLVSACAQFRHAEPTEAGLRFQLYTTLAYGGRGIGYFTYFAPAIGNYRLAPIDQFGHKTPTWDMLRSVNLQLHRLGKVYLTLKSINVFHHPEVPQGCSGLKTSRWLTHVEGANLLVGEFEGPNGQPFVMVVNKSLKDSTYVDVMFKEPGKVEYISAYTGRVDEWDGEHTWLAPGQGVLLRLGKPMEDDEPETTARVRTILSQIAESGPQQEWFATEMWTDVVESQRQAIQDTFKTLGTLEALQLVSREGPQHRRTSRYHARFAHGTLIVTMTLGQDRKITAIRASMSETE